MQSKRIKRCKIIITKDKEQEAKEQQAKERLFQISNLLETKQDEVHKIFKTQEQVIKIQKLQKVQNKIFRKQIEQNPIINHQTSVFLNKKISSSLQKKRKSLLSHNCLVNQLNSTQVFVGRMTQIINFGQTNFFYQNFQSLDSKIKYKKRKIRTYTEKSLILQCNRKKKGLTFYSSGKLKSLETTIHNSKIY